MLFVTSTSTLIAIPLIRCDLIDCGAAVLRALATSSYARRSRGPPRAADFGLRPSAERTRAYKCATPRSADNPRKVLVILECKDACQNKELPRLSGIAHLPGPHSESYVSDSAFTLFGAFGGPMAKPPAGE